MAASVCFLSTLLSSVASAGVRDDVVKQLREGQLTQAAKLIAAERKNHPKDVEIWFLEGVVQAQSGQTDKAIATFTQITQTYPQHAESFNNLGVLAASKGQLDAARAYFEKALHTNPSYAIVHKNLGDVNSQLAKTAYSKALLVDPKVKPTPVQLSMLGSTTLSPALPATPPAAHELPAPTPAKEAVLAATPVSPAPVSPTPVSPAPAAAAPASKPVAPEPVAAAPADKAVAPQKAEQPAPVMAEVPSKSQDDIERKQVEEALRAWARAWSKKDMPQYLAAYAPSFDPPGKSSRKAWEEERRIRIVGKRSIHVELSQFHIRIKGTQAQAQFAQQYDSDSFKGRSTKNLSLVKEKGRWLISSESAKPL